MQQRTPESGRHAPLRACSRCGHGHTHWAEPDDGTEKLPSRVAGLALESLIWEVFSWAQNGVALTWLKHHSLVFFWGMGM